MRGFVSDKQRRAAFANMFARKGKSALGMYTDESGRLRVSSDTIPDTSFIIQTDIEPADAKRLISELDEESLAGLRKIQFPKPSVMKAYGVESGYYTSEDEKVPFGRLDTPKIVVEAETKGRSKEGQDYTNRLAKEVARASFEHMYHEANLPDESGVVISSNLPENLLQEEFLMQLYSDYTPPRAILEEMEPIKNDLTDEVARIRALQKLEHPSILEARAWKMGSSPEIGLDTFVDRYGDSYRESLRDYVKSGLYTKEAINKRRIESGLPPLDFDGMTVEELENIVKDERDRKKDKNDEIRHEIGKLASLGGSASDSLLNFQNRPASERKKLLENRKDIADAFIKNVYEPTNAEDISDESWLRDSDVGYKTMADLILNGRIAMVRNLDNDYLDGLIDYTTGSFVQGYSGLRNKLLEEKERREKGNEFSKHYDVTKVPPGVLKDYAGMNYHAAKAMGFNDYPLKKNEVLVDERLSPEHRKRVIKHEIYEDKHMGCGEKYWDAHKEALKHEI